MSTDSGIRLIEPFPESYIELKMYARALDPSWPEGEEFPNPEYVSAVCFRRFRHDFTNYDQVLDDCHGDSDKIMKACRDVCFLAHMAYPEFSASTFHRYLKNKVHYLTGRDGLV